MTTDDDVDISPRPTTNAHARRTLTAIIIRRPSPGGHSNHARKRRATAIAVVAVVVGCPGRVGVIDRGAARDHPAVAVGRRRGFDGTGFDPRIPTSPVPPLLGLLFALEYELSPTHDFTNCADELRTNREID